MEKKSNLKKEETMSDQALEIGVNLPQQNPALALLERAIEQDVDMDKLERLVQMQKDWEARQSEIKYNEAMSAVQEKIQAVKATKQNSQTHSKYAGIVDIDREVRPVYTANGFAISFNTEKSEQTDHIKVVAYITHKAGHKETRSIDIPSDGKGAKGGDVMTKTHATMSAVTYGQRALTKMIFNIASGEFDDDGNKAGAKLPPPDGRPALSPDRMKKMLDNMVNDGDLSLIGIAKQNFSLTKDQLSVINAEGFKVALAHFKTGDLTINEFQKSIILTKDQKAELDKLTA
jgi:hypothetical protein